MVVSSDVHKCTIMIVDVSILHIKDFVLIMATVKQVPYTCSHNKQFMNIFKLLWVQILTTN